MPDKTLTDTEIKKALEDLVKCNNNEIDCGSCILSKFYPRCPEEIGELAFDLINRLQEKDETRHRVFMTKCEELKIAKADIKKLTSGKCVYLSDDEITEYCVEGPCPNYKTVAQIKFEAYKEFADNLEKAFQKTESQMPNSEVIKQTVQICRNAIRIVSRELVGEDK